jgi:hypothetical protein
MTIMNLRNAALLLSALSSYPTAVNGHGYLSSPRSRNFKANQDGAWYPLIATNPAIEVEPQSANRGGVNAACGIIAGQRNYDLPKNAVGGNMKQPNIDEGVCYQPGSVIDLEVTLTAHHKGHFEFKACPIAPYDIPTQACFDNNPLEFVSDVKYPENVHPPDYLYKERAYLAPSATSLKYRFKLPEVLKDGDGNTQLEGDLVLLQWYYITANSCTDVGYADYPFLPGWAPTVGQCTSIPADGNGVPEQVS